jgi:hypothetical protein
MILRKIQKIFRKPGRFSVGAAKRSLALFSVSTENIDTLEKGKGKPWDNTNAWF